MPKREKKGSEKGGLYIALCCAALAVAAVGYVGKKNSSYDIPDSGYLPSETSTAKTDQSAETQDRPVEKAIVTIEESPAEVVPSEKPPVSEPPSAPVSNAISIDEPILSMPVEGKVSASFSGDTLIYNEELDDWRTHNGIDILCDKDSDVLAASGGKVSEIKETPSGMSIKIDIGNGYETVYSCLSDKVNVKEGDSVEKGDIIAKIEDYPLGDLTTDTHLHFELLNKGEYVDPVIYLDD